MFTGLVQNVALVLRVFPQGKNLALTIKTPLGWVLKSGDSIATDGVCLTVSSVSRASYTTILMPQTQALTKFGKNTPEAVNLERPLTLKDYVGGHLVLGHIDCVGVVASAGIKNTNYFFTVRFPARFSRLVVPQGSIAFDGVSLTITSCAKNSATVSLIPHTIAHTTLVHKKINDKINIEFDIIGKYATRKN